MNCPRWKLKCTPLPVLNTIFAGALALAILEQIIWRGESGKLFYLPPFIFFVELLSVSLPVKRKRGLLFALLVSAFLLWQFSPAYAAIRNEHIYFIVAAFVAIIGFARPRRNHYASSTFVLIFVAITLFSLFANLGQREYFLMASEPAGSLVYADLWGFLVLISLGLFSIKSKQALSIFLSIGGAVVWICSYFFSSDFPGLFINPIAEHQYRLASCFVLLGCYCLTRGLSSEVQTASCRNVSSDYSLLRKMDALFCVLLCIVQVSIAIHLQSIVAAKPCVVSRPSYRISKEMALHLFVAEDPLFYFHNGVEYHGMRMAIKRYAETGSKRFGGSSISMQLGKVCYLSYEKTFMRKLRQILLGYILEFKYSKSQILTSYLEEISFSANTKGLIAAAAKFYSKTPDELTAEEAMTLVLSIHDPYYFSPEVERMPQVVRQRSVVTRARIQAFRTVLEERIAKIEAVM